MKVKCEVIEKTTEIKDRDEYPDFKYEYSNCLFSHVLHYNNKR